MLQIIDTDIRALPSSPEAWLHQLSKPSVIEIPGHNRDVWRIASVLIHGNEPSGFFAAYEFLRQGIVPATNLAISVASVRAARHQPLFTHRHMPGEFDLNRRFGIGECHDGVTELANQLLDYMAAKSPQYIVDLHNTSGVGPAFAVSVKDATIIRQLASLFAQEMVVTQLVVGSLMEQEIGCPIVTIECGGAKMQASHHIALEGLRRFATMPSLEHFGNDQLRIFDHPVRVKAHMGISLELGETQDDDVDITLMHTVEQCNFGETAAGTQIAWLKRSLQDSLTAINDHGEELIEDFFELREGKLFTRCRLRLFMATGRADIALSDCLFYAVAL